MYVALYRKYRPETFEDVISQFHITEALKNQVETGRTAHAYLFTGSRGTGKTTCAKILAKAINCLSPKHGNPCLECVNCKITDKSGTGASDITEIDAASNNSVDDVRLLREELVYLPVNLKKRVYIIDEVHMLSKGAFNALLKTIEEPPEHAVFILATTEIHKVPATILSRCQRFEFRRIDVKDSAERIISVANKENFTVTPDAAELISRISDGGMRDALSLLDTCASVTKEITAETVRECAGAAGKDNLFALSRAVKNKDLAAALKIIDEIHKASGDMARFTEDLILHFRNLMIIKNAPSETALLIASSDEIQWYKDESAGFNAEEILRCMDVLCETADKSGRGASKKIQVEIAAAKLCSVECAVKMSVEKEHETIPAQISASIPESIPTQIPAPIPEPIPAQIPAPIPEPIPVQISDSISNSPHTAQSSVAGAETIDWELVMGKVPIFLAGILGRFTPLLRGDSLYLPETSVISGILKNKANYDALGAAIEQVVGRKISVATGNIAGIHPQKTDYSPETAAPADKIGNFINQARERGIPVKER